MVCGDSGPSGSPTGHAGVGLRGIVDARSPGVVALVNDGHGVELQAAGGGDTGSVPRRWYVRAG